MGQRTNITSEQLNELLKANPHLRGERVKSSHVQENPEVSLKTDQKSVVKSTKKLRGSKSPNKTESAFYSFIHEERFPHAQDDDLIFEPIKLRIGENCYYCPDWGIIWDNKFRLFEVKGPHIWEDSKVKFKAAKERWGSIFEFEMWQRNGQKQWNRIM